MSHAHACPSCAKLFTCEGKDEKACAKHIAKQVKAYPCEGSSYRRQVDTRSGLYTCAHCGEADLTGSQMEPMRDGLPSDCCKDCWEAYRQSSAAHSADLIARAAELRQAEAVEGARREARKRMSVGERKRADAGIATLELFVTDETGRGAM